LSPNPHAFALHKIKPSLIVIEVKNLQKKGWCTFDGRSYNRYPFDETNFNVDFPHRWVCVSISKNIV